MTALNAAMASPRATSAAVLWGKDEMGPLPLLVLPGSSGGGEVGVDDERSTREIRIIPIKEATTPRHFRMVNFSTPMKAPKISVQTPGYYISV